MIPADKHKIIEQEALEGKPIREIARIVGCSKSTVARIINRIPDFKAKRHKWTMDWILDRLDGPKGNDH